MTLLCCGTLEIVSVIIIIRWVCYGVMVLILWIDKTCVRLMLAHVVTSAKHAVGCPVAPLHFAPRHPSLLWSVCLQHGQLTGPIGCWWCTDCRPIPSRTNSSRSFPAPSRLSLPRTRLWSIREPADSIPLPDIKAPTGKWLHVLTDV